MHGTFTSKRLIFYTSIFATAENTALQCKQNKTFWHYAWYDRLTVYHTKHITESLSLCGDMLNFLFHPNFFEIDQFQILIFTQN